MSNIIEFYRGNIPTPHGKYLNDILAYSDKELEEDHQYIQWLFPLEDISAYNPNAPTLTFQDIIDFSDRYFQTMLSASFSIILSFYSLEYAQNGLIIPIPYANMKWITSFNHNYLRLTRIIKSLSLLGKLRNARELYYCLHTIASYRREISPETLNYWHKAAFQ